MDQVIRKKEVQVKGSGFKPPTYTQKTYYLLEEKLDHNIREIIQYMGNYTLMIVYEHMTLVDRAQIGVQTSRVESSFNFILRLSNLY